MRVCPEIKNRGTRNVLMVVCDGLKGLPDAVNAVWEKTIVQRCMAHLLRNSFRYASKKDWAQIARPQARLYGGVRGRGARPVRRILREMGKALPGHYTALGERVGRIRAVPWLRPGNKDRDLHDQRDRIH
jgi:transposase-like protein